VGGMWSVDAVQLSIVSLHCTAILRSGLLLEQAVIEPTPSKEVSLKKGMVRIMVAMWNRNFMSTYTKYLLECNLGKIFGMATMATRMALNSMGPNPPSFEF